MIIVGEKINTSRKSISEAVEKRDARAIVAAAHAQAEAGANYIDVNAGTFLGRETECLCWLVETIQKEIDIPLCLDSPSPSALSEAMKRHEGEPMVNSISLERERFESMLPVVTARPCSIVALCMSQTSMPTTVDERVETGSELIKRLLDSGISLEKIFVDPLVQPVSVDTSMAESALAAIKQIMDAFPGVRTICGLSNVSYGLPNRRLINRNFLALSMAKGLTAAILDPTDRQLMATVRAVEMLLGRDDYCEKFIESYETGKLVNC